MPGPYGQRSDPTSNSLVVRHPKRRGVALSCAECRRLKLKCSRDFPYSNCVKKGCAAICPDGSLTTGKGNRFVLANTEALHEKINLLANRVRHLEDGLAEAHSLTSHHPHPLLREDLLQIKRPLERERLDVPPVEEKPDIGDSIDSLGSLSISQDGRSTFFGQTANSWYLLQNEGSSDEEGSPPTADNSPVPVPADLSWLSYGFPFATPPTRTAENVRNAIMSKLPVKSAAKVICDIYFRHAAWMYTPISEQDFQETIFQHIYDPEPNFEAKSGQNIGIFCMVLAIGTLVDLDKPAHSAGAMYYYHLARAALSIDSILEEQSITGIQALLLMCHFMFLSEISGPRWVIMGIVVKLAQSVGLHRDSGKWNLDPEQTQKRRNLFCELLTYDSWQSLTYGRPPSLSPAHIDNQLLGEGGKTDQGEMTFAEWKHRFSAQCLSVVHDQAFGTRTPSYKVIQELDRKVRNWYMPPSLQVPGFGTATKLATTELEQPSVQLTMQRYVAFAIKEITLFYMHRGFFAQALEDCPNDPMGSKYSPSVLAAYGSATAFVGLVESLFNQHPALTERMWFLFTHVFSCAIVLGSIAAKSQMGLAPSALSHLESAFNLFSRVSDHARAGKIIPILQKLKERAHLANDNIHPTNENATRLSYFGPKIKSEIDELSTLGGVTRLVSRGSPSSSSSVASEASPPTKHTSPSTRSDSQVYLTPPDSSLSSTAWQNYTHIQNFNVNINLNDGYYPHTSSPATPVPQGDMSMLYQLPNHMQQQSQGMQMELSPDSYYSYQQQSNYNSGYPPAHQHHHHMAPGHDMSAHQGPPMYDVNESWHNFMAPYKP
ncbi:hypothetical protein BYT27DRAFT_7235766 [Phlegmacium glaucopus]|nr:hypothetical protein BYT27DRAFT_7235766 [Phlegmacium glaucopus]